LAFWGDLGPLGVPGASPREGFYINPSRRGPAVPGGPGSRTGLSRRDWGKPPEGVQGEPLVVA